MMKRGINLALVLILVVLAVIPFSFALPNSSTIVQGKACEMAHSFSYDYNFEHDTDMEIGQSYELAASFKISNSIVTTNPYQVDVSLSADGFELSETELSLADGPKTITIKPTKIGAKISITGRLLLDGDDRRHPGYQAIYFDNFELDDFSIGKEGSASGSNTTITSDDKTINTTVSQDGEKTTTNVEVERNEPSKAPWYIVRITGMIAYVLLALSMLMGILRKLNPSRFGRLCSLHCDISYLALIFAFLHGVNNLVDKYMWNLGVRDVFWLSFGTQNKNLLSIGVIAFYIMAAVTISSVSPKIMALIKRKRWYAIHIASYLAYLFVVLHSFKLGTDLSLAELSNPLTLISSILFWGLFAANIVALVIMLIKRIGKRDKSKTQGRDESKTGKRGYNDSNVNDPKAEGDACEVQK